MIDRENLDEVKTRLDKFLDLDKYADECMSKAVEGTRCGFDYGLPGCNICMYQEHCREGYEAKARHAWQIQAIVMTEYRKIEQELRKMQDMDEKNEDVLAALAKVLRAMAGSGSVIETGLDPKLTEAEKIFRELYYNTGDRDYMEEAESCAALNRR